MIVAYDHQIFAEQAFGGISRYAAELAQRVARLPGFEVRLFQGIHVNRYAIPADPGLRRCGVRVPALRGTRRLRETLGDLVFRATDWAGQADVFHPTYFRHLPSPPRCRRVVTVHDMTEELFPAMLNPRTSARKRRAVREADGIICISQRTAEDLQTILGPLRVPLTVVPQAASLLAAASPDRPHPRPYLLYVGLRFGTKNWACLRTAYERDPRLHRDFDLVCVGGGPPTAEERPAAGHVAFLTGDDRLLATCYRHAAAFVYPSRYEGFGIPPLEAMAYGCPVVAARAGAIPEVVGDAAELFEPSSADELAETLVRVLGDQDRRAALVANGHRRRAMYSWDRTARETAAFYRVVTGES